MKENAILLTPHDFVSPPTSAVSNFIETSIGRHRIVVPRVGRTERRPHSRRNTIRIGPLTILYPYQPTERASPSTFLFTGPFRCQPDGLRRHATNCVVLFHRGRTTRFFFLTKIDRGGIGFFGCDVRNWSGSLNSLHVWQVLVQCPWQSSDEITL